MLVKLRTGGCGGMDFVETLGYNKVGRALLAGCVLLVCVR